MNVGEKLPGYRSDSREFRQQFIETFLAKGELDPSLRLLPQWPGAPKSIQISQTCLFEPFLPEPFLPLALLQHADFVLKKEAYFNGATLEVLPDACFFIFQQER